MNKREMLHKYFSDLGRKSGKARMKKMTPEERSRVASLASKARWAEEKSRGKGSK